MSAAYLPGRDVGVAVSDNGATIYLAHLPDGPLLVLEGVAALIWHEATTAPAEGWVERVATTVHRSVADITAEVEAFVRDLRDRRLVQPSSTNGPLDC